MKKFSMLLLMFILFASVSLVHSPEVSGATAWAPAYSSWQYRTAITITNPNNYTLTDFQVNVTLNASWPGWAHVSENGSDIRFALANGTTLPYWIQSWNYTAKTAVIWIKVPSIPAESSITAYIYYGNPSATSESNGSAVFVFFDDFETWSGWTTYGSGVVSQSSTVAYDGKYSAKKDTNADPNGAYKALPVTLDFPFVLEAEIDRTYLSGANADRIGVIDSSGNGYGICVNHGTSPTVAIDTRSSYSGTNHDNTALKEDVVNKWYFARFVWDNGNMKAEVYYNGQLLGSTTYTNASYSSFTRIYIFGGYTYYVDDLRIRKYAPQMPSVTVSTTEEKYAFPVTFHIMDTNGQPVENATVIIDSQTFPNINNGTVLYISWGQHNITITKPPQYAPLSITINITNSTTINATLKLAYYNITFYAFYNHTPIEDYQVFIGNESLGTFNNSQHVSLPYGQYTLTFEKLGYSPITVKVNLTGNTNVTFITYKLNGSLITFQFYDSKNNTPLSNVTVVIANNTFNKTYILNSGNSIYISHGNFTIVAKKQGYLPKSLNVSISTTTTAIIIYLQPTSSNSPSAILPISTPSINTTLFNVTNETNFIGAKVFNDLVSFHVDKATRDFLHLSPLFAIFIPLIMTLGLATASWFFSRNSLVVLGVIAISATFWYLLGAGVQLSLIQPLAVVIIFFIAWAIWGFYRTKEVGE